MLVVVFVVFVAFVALVLVVLLRPFPAGAFVKDEH